MADHREGTRPRCRDGRNDARLTIGVCRAVGLRRPAAGFSFPWGHHLPCTTPRVERMDCTVLHVRLLDHPPGCEEDEFQRFPDPAGLG